MQIAVAFDEIFELRVMVHASSLPFYNRVG